MKWKWTCEGRKCLAQSPTDRWQSMAEIKPYLEKVLARPARTYGIAAGVVLVLLGGAAGFEMRFPRSAHALTDKDMVVLADFANSTGDLLSTRC